MNTDSSDGISCLASISRPAQSFHRPPAWVRTCTECVREWLTPSHNGPGHVVGSCTSSSVPLGVGWGHLRPVSGTSMQLLGQRSFDSLRLLHAPHRCLSHLESVTTPLVSHLHLTLQRAYSTSTCETYTLPAARTSFAGLTPNAQCSWGPAGTQPDIESDEW